MRGQANAFCHACGSIAMGCSVSSAFPRMLPMLQHTYGCHSPRVTNGNNGGLGWRFVLVLAPLASQPGAEYAPLQRGRMRSKSLFPGRVLPENSGWLSWAVPRNKPGPLKRRVLPHFARALKSLISVRNFLIALPMEQS